MMMIMIVVIMILIIMTYNLLHYREKNRKWKIFDYKLMMIRFDLIQYFFPDIKINFHYYGKKIFFFFDQIECYQYEFYEL